jgi:hypothetical protein
MPTTYIRNAGTWPKLKKAFIRNGGYWSEIKTIWVRDSGVWSKYFVNLVTVNVTAQNNINLKTLYTTQTGEIPSSGVSVLFNINGNIGSTSTGTPSLITDTWPSGTELTINVGSGVYIAGAGGIISHLGNGGNGGTAISLSHNVTIVNNGVIGGGGGAGGGVNFSGYGTMQVNGGNGAGLTAGSGATVTTGGGGGYAESNACYAGFCSCWFRTYGGAGGGLGANGTAGQVRWSGNGCNTDQYYTGGGAGGTAGNAIVLNGNTATRSGSGQTLGNVV